MGSGLIPAGRRAEILNELKTRGFAGVDELAGLFDVSVITIRRDLDQLESDGLVERTHGGAIYKKHIRSESTYIEKDSRNHELKLRIGARAAEFAEAGDTVFVNSGSTTFQLIRALSARGGIRIVTNNIAAALESGPSEESELVLIGGMFRYSSGCTVGDFAQDMINRINTAVTFIGADGISLKNGITSPVSQEAAVTRMMIEKSSGPVVLAADSTKIGSVTTFFTAPLDAVDYLVTDDNFDEAYRPDFEEAGIEIIIA